MPKKLARLDRTVDCFLIFSIGDDAKMFVEMLRWEANMFFFSFFVHLYCVMCL